MRAPLSPPVVAVPELLRAPQSKPAREPSKTTSAQQAATSPPAPTSTTPTAPEPRADQASSDTPRRLHLHLAGSSAALLFGLVAVGLLALVLVSALRPGGAHRRR
jgi:hypothetical protein